MELTPIRNLGKHISRENQVVMSPGKVKKSGQDYSSSDVPRAPDEKIKQVDSIISQPRYKVSALEKLPTEIVEKIFKLCLNLDLPRSSPVIGAKLANWNIYKSLILSGFEVTWRKSLPVENEEDLEQEDVKCKKRQTDILRCRWATKALIVIYQQWIEEKSSEPPKPICMSRYFKLWQIILLTRTEGVDFNSPADNLGKAQPLENPYEQAFFDKEFESFRAITRLRENIPRWKDLCWDRNSIVSSGAEIPDSLLLGPWSEEMLKKLFFIIRLGASIENWYSNKGETLFTGLRNAVKVGNIGALYLLLWALDWNSERAGFFNHDFNGRNLITFAIRNVGGDYVAFMSHLLNLSRGLISPADKAIIVRDFAILENDAALKEDRKTLDRLIQMKRVSISLLK
ncbi:hypothetical protein BGHDH14_bghG000309000001001 [Blumeria hordei DH14]|uniref:Uncharacterized protein n=1 Tax=Blumeria graminis f. sp. hordei (strain DH14) TaxID=546991 RepID=N1J9B8_BLUG1|nr:hypothetical protein BGHDH14_bghG000309000001001 [Blumeria hordei DH14]